MCLMVTSLTATLSAVHIKENNMATLTTQQKREAIREHYEHDVLAGTFDEDILEIIGVAIEAMPAALIDKEYESVSQQKAAFRQIDQTLMRLRIESGK